MASPSPDPFAETNSEAPSQPAPAPAKRSLFKNRKPKVVKTAEEEAAEALNFFSRSKEIFPEAIREQRERREREERRKQEKEEERRRLEEEDAARQLEIEQRRQETLETLKRGGSQDEFIEGRERRPRSRSYSPTRDTPPPRRGSRDSPVQLDDNGASPPHKRRSPRNQRTTRSQVEKPVISLSSSEDEDDDIKLAKQRSLHKTPAGYDDFASSPPGAPRPSRPSPEVEELPQEDEMFPELVAAARAQAAAEQAEKLEAMQRRLGRTKSASSNGSGSPREGGVDSPVPLPSSPLVTREVKEDAVIAILVSSRVEGLTKPIIVKRKLSQRLKDVRMAWCDIQVIQEYRPMSEIEKEMIFLSWRGRRVWDVTTAESLGIKVNARGHVVDERGLDLGDRIVLEAWTQEAYEQWQKEKKAEKHRLAAGTPYIQGQQVDLSDDESAALDLVEAPPAAQPESTRIKIILKPRTGEPVKLIVKPTTLVETIVKGFIQQRQELCGGKQVELWFDGERLEEGSSVGEADVKDMSGIDVVFRDVVRVNEEAQVPVVGDAPRGLKRRRESADNEEAVDEEAQPRRPTEHEDDLDSDNDSDPMHPTIMTHLTLLHPRCAPVKLALPEQTLLSEVVEMFRQWQKRLTRGKEIELWHMVRQLDLGHTVYGNEMGDGWMLDVQFGGRRWFGGDGRRRVDLWVVNEKGTYQATITPRRAWGSRRQVKIV